MSTPCWCSPPNPNQLLGLRLQASSDVVPIVAIDRRFLLQVWHEIPRQDSTSGRKPEIHKDQNNGLAKNICIADNKTFKEAVSKENSERVPDSEKFDVSSN
ncbi:hypothetical protein SUGI_1029250 [Cryptomeria japonica]|nr:hypothetical protein SUGI_1029250 [Cryptomeria japonica]